MSEYLPPLTVEEAEVAIDVMAENKRLRARLAAVEAERDEAQERSADWHIKADGFRRERDRLWAERDEAREALTTIADCPEPLGPPMSSAAAQCDYLKSIARAALRPSDPEQRPAT